MYTARLAPIRIEGHDATETKSCSDEQMRTLALMDGDEQMIDVCLKDGFAVYQYDTVVQFVDAFPDGLEQSNIDNGCYVNCSVQDARDIAWEREDRKRRVNTRLPFVGQKCRD